MSEEYKQVLEVKGQMILSGLDGDLLGEIYWLI